MCLLAAAYSRGRILVHPAPVLFHRFQILEFFIANVALEGFGTARPKESSHAL
jgi:hypothetical protein